MPARRWDLVKLSSNTDGLSDANVKEEDNRKKKTDWAQVYHPLSPKQKLKNPPPDVPPFWLPQAKIQLSTTPRHPSHYRHAASLPTDGLPTPPPASLPKSNYWLPDVPSYIPVDFPTNPIIH